jgi:hypothetical protein
MHRKNKSLAVFSEDPELPIPLFGYPSRITADLHWISASRIAQSTRYAIPGKPCTGPWPTIISDPTKYFQKYESMFRPL